MLLKLPIVLLSIAPKIFPAMLKLCPVVPHYAHIKLCLDSSIRVYNTSLNFLLGYFNKW